MSSPSHEALSTARARGADARPDAIPWVVTGLGSGVIGAAVVALFFLVLDLLGGHPLATPNTLGATLFRGEVLPSSAPLEPALVVGYTAIHGLVFVGFGLIGAFLVMTGERGLSPARAAVLALGLLAVFEVVFLVFAALFEPDLVGRLGAGWVTVANALAAVAMVLFLRARDGSARRADGAA